MIETEFWQTNVKTESWQQAFVQGHYNKVDFGFINNETFTDPLSYLLVDYNQSKTESFQSNGLLGMALATDENGQKHGFLEQVFSNYPNML